MFNTIYIEQAIAHHPRTQQILQRLSGKRIVPCQYYGELLNPKAQNFLLQKQNPALILAKKQGNRVLAAPQGYSIGAEHNYYFSHMLNCIYDCRYCFLQGMYQSAHAVLFVNYEEFIDDIKDIAMQHAPEPVHFFSGYDGDSLALEPVSSFASTFIKQLRCIPNAWLELRTKSTQVRKLLNTPPREQVIVAFSFTPDAISKAIEHGVPKLEQRIEALSKLQQHGWSVGLRLDPLIDCENFTSLYQELLELIFKQINASQIHSVSFGSFRMPDTFFNRIVRLYPEEKLFASHLEHDNGMVSYGREREIAMRSQLQSLLLKHVDSSALFPCETL